ncbi:MAG: magnesium/cobalt transporter CorA, partial [Geminicoccaceae bacterium]
MLHRRRRREHRPSPGEPPGSLSPAPYARPTHLHLVAYDADRLIEHQSQDVAEIEARARGVAHVWIDVAGLRDVDTIRAIGERYCLHPLTLEDIVQVVQRPKVDIYEGYLFVVLRLPHFDKGLVTEQLAIVLGDDFVISFGERPCEGFDAVRRRLGHVHSRMRNKGVDYLAYAVIDALIDAYFPILERYGELMDQLEVEIVERTTDGLVTQIHGLRRTVMELRRAIWPLREVLNTLTREGTPYFQPETRVFLRDCSDHVSQLLDMIEIDREVTSTLLDLHLSSLSARMNEIMKVLTIIATIFIPLGFFAGLYGMNFSPEVSPYNMPELHWRYGYPYALLVMAAIAIGMLAYFWAKGWIGG